MSAFTFSISGELWHALRHETTISVDGKACWGYAPSDEADLEVEAMVHAAKAIRRGYGYSYEMTGSREAWMGIREYAADRAYIEQNGAGDFDRSLGRRLDKQAARLDAELAGQRAG